MEWPKFTCLLVAVLEPVKAMLWRRLGAVQGVRQVVMHTINPSRGKQRQAEPFYIASFGQPQLYSETLIKRGRGRYVACWRGTKAPHFIPLDVKSPWASFCTSVSPSSTAWM